MNFLKRARRYLSRNKIMYEHLSKSCVKEHLRADQCTRMAKSLARLLGEVYKSGYTVGFNAGYVDPEED